MKAFIKQHYYWVIALIVLLEMFIYVGILNNINGLYIIPISETLGISRGEYSLAFSAKALAGALSVVLSGPFLRRFGYRKMAGSFLLVAVMAFLVLSSSQNLLMLYVGAIMIGMCEGSCLTAGATFVVDRWFHRCRGSVLGFVTAATGIGGSATCILLTKIITASGWRISLAVCAGLTAVMALLILLFIRDHPSDIGLKPFGEGELSGKKKKEKDHWHGFTMKELVRLPNFYLTILEVFLSCLCLYIGFYVIVPYLQSRGFTQAEAASMQSIMLLGMAGFKLLCGVLSDWIGAKSTAGICFVATSVSFYLLIQTDSIASATAAVIVFALALPMTTVTIPLLTASLFGYCAHNTSNGIFLALPAVAGMIASPLTNMVFDKTGSYLPAFRGALILSIAVLLLHIVICFISNIDKNKLNATEDIKEEIP